MGEQDGSSAASAEDALIELGELLTSDARDVGQGRYP